MGRDRVSSQSKPLLPLLHDGKARSYSFQGAKKESVTIFHTLSDTSSSRSESSNSGETSQRTFLEEELATKSKAKAKAKTGNEAKSSSDDGDVSMELWRSPSEPATSSRGTVNPLFEELHGEDEVESLKRNNSRRSLSLKKRRALSSTS